MAAVLVLPVSPWGALSLPGLIAPFLLDTSWTAPSPPKKVCRGSRAQPALQQGCPSPRAEPPELSGCGTEMV